MVKVFDVRPLYLSSHTPPPLYAPASTDGCVCRGGEGEGGEEAKRITSAPVRLCAH